jgi:RNA polymerase sigma-70 factor (ECF subfamily)
LTTEANIASQLQQQDKAAFEHVFREFYAPLVGFATKYTNDQSAAEEVVQDVFYRMWNKANSLDIHTSVKAYLYGAVRNSCLNYIKHQKTKQEHVEHTKYTSSDASEIQPMELDELQEEINAAIQKLPEKCREVFLLSRMENKKYKEIAETLNISIKTVENQMGKALKILREQLAKHLPILLLLGINLTDLINSIGVIPI